MKDWFYALADYLDTCLQGDEVYLVWFSGEDSDFIRFNQAKVRQAGSVAQRYINLELIHGQRHATYAVTLTGVTEEDRSRLHQALAVLREQLAQVPEDPYLLYADNVQSGDNSGSNRLPPATDVLDEILQAVAGKDFVGIYAHGGIYNGFANSLGQRNWHSRYSFNLDWSFYHAGDKAVKTGYAGFDWDSAAFRAKMAHAGQQLAALARPPHTLSPGRYRVYLAPAAVQEIIQMLAWGGFSLKAQRTKQSPLIHWLEGRETLHPAVTLTENTAAGTGPDFQGEGFRKPAQVPLIQGGQPAEALVSPRSAKEYGVPGNAANGGEAPESPDMAAGDLDHAEILPRLDNGVYVNNLWYLNYSDHSACRLTGMTRFATFWVENGEIVAPLNVMRFDDTVYHILGKNLTALTKEREFLLDPETYGARSTHCARLPGALVEDFTLTL